MQEFARPMPSIAANDRHARDVEHRFALRQRKGRYRAPPGR
jgi:hypothetical protein